MILITAVKTIAGTNKEMVLVEVTSGDDKEEVHVGEHFGVSLPLPPPLQKECVDAANVAGNFYDQDASRMIRGFSGVSNSTSSAYSQ